MLTKIGSKRETAILVKLLREEEDIVLYDPHPKFPLSGGGFSKYYVDLKKALGEPLIRRRIAGIMARHVADDDTFVASEGYGGIPFATEVSSLTGVKLTMVRDKEKEHGKGGWIDGFVPHENDKGLVVDDVLTKGGSLRHIERIVTSTGATVSKRIVGVNRGNPVLDFDVSYILRVGDLRPK